jgi:hypothetical protein
MKRFRIQKVAKVIVFVIAGLFIIGSIVMLLWNALLPALFHLPAITFWQALGLLILSKLLFGGFRGGSWQRPPHWKHRMQQRWMNMTPEEKEKFKQEWRNRCGPGRWFEEQKPVNEKNAE